MDFNLELEKAADAIKNQEAKLVLIQLPDGLKPRAMEISDKLREKTGARILIWGGSNFGACDIPVEAKNLNVDLVISFGHSSWR